METQNMTAVLSKPLRMILMGLIVFFISFVAENLLQEKGFSPGSDEGYYYSYAKEVKDHGPGYIGNLIDEYFKDIKKQFYPPPTRIGYIIASSILFHLSTSYWILGLFSFVCFLLFLAVNFHYVHRYLGEKIAFWTTALLSSSPLLLAMSRRALTDSATNLLICWSIWLFYDFMVRGKKQTYNYFLAIFSLSLMFKESNVFLLVFFILAWFLYFPLRKKNWYELVGLILTGLIAGFIIPGAIVGFERWAHALTKLAYLQREVFLFNPYVAQYCSGPWYRYLLDFLLLSPWILLFFVGYVFYFLTKEKKALIEKYLFGYFLMNYIFMIPLQKNIRYVMSLEMILIVFAVLMITVIVQRFFIESRRDWCATVIVCVLAVYNFGSFVKIFISWGLLDPVSVHLLRIRSFIL